MILDPHSGPFSTWDAYPALGSCHTQGLPCPALSLPHPHRSIPVPHPGPLFLLGVGPDLFLPPANGPGPPGPGAAGPRGGGRLLLPQVRGSHKGWVHVMWTGYPGRPRSLGVGATALTPFSPCSQVDRLVALARMRQSGVFLSTSEGLILQLVGDASHPQFKEVLAGPHPPPPMHL